MASYAALLSLTHTLNQIKNHPRPPISIHQQQLHSLTQNLTFLINFLERYSGREDEDLESRIADAAYAAEDVIEAHIVDQAGSTSDHGKNISPVDLYGGLEKVIQELDLIKREVVEIMIKEENTGAQLYDDQLGKKSSVSASSRQSSTMVVFDDVLINKVLDELSGQQSNLQIISIDGMGGIGKTTLATHIYSHPLIVQHFDILAWVTISQTYSSRRILSQVLCEENIGSEDELGERVHKMLWGRRYLIVMDDIWSTEAFDKVRCYFPDNNNGSRIMITTRLSNLAFELSGSHVFQMEFLDDDKSWGLLCETVFDKVLGCPIELENIGKEIARNCRGLPLSIVVIGGLLKKIKWTWAHWEYILQNLNSLLNLEDNEYCLQILYTSYKELPVYLKPCFLYMGVFPEDYVICVSSLVKFWVAEGILRPIGGKRLEEVAEKYVNELIDRNLILIDKLRWNGKAKLCKMHDLLRDLGIREAKKQRFLCVLKHQQSLNIPQCMNMERRICIHQNIEEEYSPQFFHALEFASLTRSLIPTSGLPESVQSLSFRLLRVYSEDIYSNGLASAKAVFQRVNMRLLNIALRLPQLSRFPSSWFLFWNLQTLKVDIKYSLKPVIAPSEIWEMPLLRHVMIKDLQLPDLLCGENDLILEDLQTLSRISNFKCNEVVIKRIPNIKTLKLKYHISFGETEYLDFGHLKELESLNIFMDRTAILDGKTFQRYLEQNLSLPHSLKKLTLRGTMLNWEECTTKIGSLPLLECLRLDWEACCGAEWETVEGQFCSLKVLRIDSCNLRYWITDSTHFPRLEDLLLRLLVDLEEIPLSIGDIPTLKSIRLDGCSTSAADSARRIIEEQRELENMDLQLHIIANGAQVLTPDDGFSFIKEVKDTFQYQTEKYDRFLEVMTDSNDERYVKEVHLIIKNGLCS
ncbi:hypothetical protein ACS0TY_000167 [Phlomoides rotata]